METSRKPTIGIRMNGKTVWNPDWELIDAMTIDEYMERVSDHRNEIRTRFRMLRESWPCVVYGDELPDDIIKRFKRNPYRDYILENLQTHDNSKLLSGIKKAFPGSDIEVSKSTKTDIGAVCVYVPIPENLTFGKSSKTLYKVADFYGYTISMIEDCTLRDKPHNGMLAVLEPVYSESANDLVYTQCRGTIYHITSAEHADNILENGLKIKKGVSNGRKPAYIYREFPRRIYFLCFPWKRGDRDVMDSPDFIESLMTYISDEVRDNGFSVMRIDIRKGGYNFYTDSMADIQDGPGNPVYCYNNIPPSMITEIFSGSMDDMENKNTR